MNDVSKKFAKGDWPKAFNSAKPQFPIPQELKDVANAFVDLQQARHDADYNLAMKFTRSETVDLVERSRQAFQDWKKIRKHDLARVYLGCFLLSKQWDRER